MSLSGQILEVGQFSVGSNKFFDLNVFNIGRNYIFSATRSNPKGSFVCYIFLRNFGILVFNTLISLCS